MDACRPRLARSASRLSLGRRWLFGLCIGSFLNVVIHRLPKMMEREWRAECAALARASRSRRRRRAYNLRGAALALPAAAASRISALAEHPAAELRCVLRGRCAGCSTRIGARTRWSRLLAGIGAAYCAWRFGFTLAALGAALFIWFTIALAFIDQETGLPARRPDPAADLAGPAVQPDGAFVPLPEAVIGAAAGYLVLWLVYWGFKLATGKEGMGYGDFKMNAAVGAFLGWKMLPLVILLSSVVGLAVRRAADVRRARRAGTAVPLPFRPLPRDRRHRRAVLGRRRSCAGTVRLRAVLCRFVVGLTGGIGSGKSAAAREFAALGATVVDTDAIAHELTGSRRRRAAGDREALRRGRSIGADGAMDRPRMRERVFADPAAKQRARRRCCTR